MQRYWKALRHLACALCGALLGMAGAWAEEAPRNLRYSHATQLQLRAAPAADAAVLTQLPINQAMEIAGQREKRWCEVRLLDGARRETGQRGFVDCAFLGEQELDAKAIEIEVARLFLELNAPKISPADEARILGDLFTQLERAFALSPSLYVYGDYKSLYEAMRRKTGNWRYRYDKEESIQPLRTLEESRAAVLEHMRRSLSRQNWEAAQIPVRHSLLTTLRQLLLQRRYGDILLPEGQKRRYTELPGGALTEPAPKASFFSKGQWATGWAGGPMIHRLHGSNPVAYRVGFNGVATWVLADVYEMAKVHRTPVNAGFATVKGVDTLILETKFPLWAITRDGLVQGHLRQASFGGDECTRSMEGIPVATAAEIVFERPVAGRIYGVFASSAPFDPARAKVTVQARAFSRDGESGPDTALTYREEASVDIDADGVADLRILLSSDEGVHYLDPARPRWASLSETQDRGGFRRVGGWYANDSYSLQVNEDGWWRLLSLYNVVTCT